MLCGAMDLNNGLALAATAAADPHGAGAAGSELMLLDGLKARSKRGWGRLSYPTISDSHVDESTR